MVDSYFKKLKKVGKYVKKIEKDLGTRIVGMSCLVENYDAVIKVSVAGLNDIDIFTYFRDLAKETDFRGVRIGTEYIGLFVKKYVIELKGV